MRALGWSMKAEVADRVRARIFEIHGITVRDDGRAYERLASLGRELGRRYREVSIGSIEGIGEARRLYRSFGIDPTRTRPSSEALLRRCRKDQELYRINEVVDTGNWVSLEYLLPLGLYDRDRVVGETLTLGVGRTGDSYPGIRKADVNVGGRLCVADAEGPMGSPTSDSLRTSIRPETTALTGVVFAPVDGDPERLAAASDALISRLLEFAGGELMVTGSLGEAGGAT